MFSDRLVLAFAIFLLPLSSEFNHILTGFCYRSAHYYSVKPNKKIIRNIISDLTTVTLSVILFSLELLLYIIYIYFLCCAGAKQTIKNCNKGDRAWVFNR